MKTDSKKSNYKQILKLFLSAFILLALKLPCLAETSIDPIENIIEKTYQAWNAHDIEKLFSYYSNNFVTADGIDKQGYKELTETLWQTYPDIQIKNEKRTIRSQDQYATASMIDLFYGQSKEKNDQIGENGKLNAISQGQIFFKKYGNEWKIESDRIYFELVTIYYGNAKEYLDNHQIYFGAPEQVQSGEQYTASLYFILPESVQATATINKELITYPHLEAVEESYQGVSNHKLERLFGANDKNLNELVSSTIILTKGLIEPKLEGILYISKRVNVLSQKKKLEKKEIVKTPFAKSKEPVTEDTTKNPENNDEES